MIKNNLSISKSKIVIVFFLLFTNIIIGQDFIKIAGNESIFTTLDAIAPTITYTPLTNTASNSNRDLTNVTITDVDGVNTTAGTKPRIYFKRDFDDNVYNSNTSATPGWKYAETSSGSSPFTFTINYSLLLLVMLL